MSDVSPELLVSLGEVAAEPVEQTGPTNEFVYVDISSVDRETKRIFSAKTIVASEVPSRAKQVLRSGDVLISMTRPNLNAVALVPNHLDGAIGSTGFHVLRSRWIKPEFLFGLVQTDGFIDSMCDVVQGALYPAVRPKDIAAFKFVLQSPNQQTRIVEKLEELLSDLDAGVAELKAAQKKLGQYRQSLLKAAVEGSLTAQWRTARTPLPPGGGGAGGEGASTNEERTSTPATEPEPWFQARARDLRQQQTPDEQALWQQLRAKRFSGYKFRRQQVLGRFIVDFVCFAQRLIVELDGGQHAEAVDHDNQRDTWLTQQGFRVLRFWNNEWRTQPEAVLEAIWQALRRDPPLPNPSPARGEGLIPETGAQMLQRILTERRARWEAKQTLKFAEQGKPPPKDWQKKYPEPVQPDTSGLPELPEGWVWASVDQIASDEPYSLAIGPFGSNLKVPDYREAGVPLIFVRNIRSGNYGGAFTRYVTPEKAVELSPHSVASGDVLITKMGEPPGDADVYPADQPPAIITADCIKVRCWVGLMRPDFLKIAINSYIGQRQIEPRTQGVAQKKVSLGRFTSLAVPVPSIQEQDRMMASVSVANANAAAQAVAIEISLKQCAAQRKNILRAAFSGQLVPQDPSDEPASVLLARIRAERLEHDAVKKPRGRKTKEPS